MLVNVRAKCRRKRLQFRNRQVLQLAMLFYAGLNRMGHNFVRPPEWHALAHQVGRRSLRVHESVFKLAASCMRSPNLNSTTAMKPVATRTHAGDPAAPPNSGSCVS